MEINPNLSDLKASKRCRKAGNEDLVNALKNAGKTVGFAGATVVNTGAALANTFTNPLRAEWKKRKLKPQLGIIREDLASAVECAVHTLRDTWNAGGNYGEALGYYLSAKNAEKQKSQRQTPQLHLQPQLSIAA